MEYPKALSINSLGVHSFYMTNSLDNNLTRHFQSKSLAPCSTVPRRVKYTLKRTTGIVVMTDRFQFNQKRFGEHLKKPASGTQGLPVNGIDRNTSEI